MLDTAGETWTPGEAAHLLSRAGFGGCPEEIRALHALGRSRAVDALLSSTEPEDAFPVPDWATEEKAMAAMQQRIEQRKEYQAAMASMSPEEADLKKREAFKEIQRTQRLHALEGQGWWFRRMLKTQAPLREKMTLFWHDHFATSVEKVKQPALMIWQNETFRRHATGSFKALTKAMLFDPAMLLYLDAQNSKKGQPNENFAREILELFTLGEGHYTEQDIRESARAFTGYQLNRRTGKVFHNRRQWDDGEKTVFGKTGPYKGEQVIDLIFQQGEPSRFMAEKIWEYFVSENPPQPVIDSLSTTLRGADYQLKPMLRELFLSRDFYASSVIRSQIKCPVQYLVGMLKQLEINEPPTGFPIVAQQQLGQTLFLPPNVAGWDWGKAWVNTNTLLTRYNLAGFLTKGSGDAEKAMNKQRDKMPGMAAGPLLSAQRWPGPDYEKIAPRPQRADPAALVDSLIQRFFQGPVPDKARESFVSYANAKKGVIFTNKEVAELCHLMLSTPYYQLT